MSHLRVQSLSYFSMFRATLLNLSHLYLSLTHYLSLLFYFFFFSFSYLLFSLFSSLFVFELSLFVFLCLHQKDLPPARRWFLSQRNKNKLLHSYTGNIELFPSPIPLKVSSAAPTQYLKEFSVPQQINTSFTDLYKFGPNFVTRGRNRAVVCNLAVASLVALGGGDLYTLIEYMSRNNSSFKKAFDQIVADRNNQVNNDLDSLTSSITSALDFLSDPPKKEEEEKDKENSSTSVNCKDVFEIKRKKRKLDGKKGISHIDQDKQKLLRSILANSHLTYQYLTKQGLVSDPGNFSNLRKKCAKISLRAVLEDNKSPRGRKKATDTHPEILAKYAQHLHAPENSTLSNTRHLKRTTEPVRELIRPHYHTGVSSGFQIPKVSGGRKSSSEGLSYATLRKYSPRNIVAPISNTMLCSDCIQRRQNINFFNRVFKTQSHVFMEWHFVGHLEDIVGTVEAVVELALQNGFPKRLLPEFRKRFEQLIGTQIHYTIFRFQITLRRSTRLYLPLRHGVLVCDFAQSFEVGHKQKETEATWRNLSLVTVFAVTFEYKLPGQDKNVIIHNAVFCNDLVHSSFSACRYIDTVVNSERISSLLKSLDTLHVFNDNATHLSCLEHSTYLHTVLIKKFPNLMLLTENRHAAKHGKDSADATVALVKRAVSILEKQELGFTDPKTDFTRLRQTIELSEKAQKSATGKSSELNIFWLDAVTVPTTYKVLVFDSIDSSACRKSFRLKPNAPVHLVECFRFDVPVGIELSLKLHIRKRPKQKQRHTEAMALLEEGVCSPVVQQNRDLKRITNIREIGHMLKQDVSAILMGYCPDRVDLERKPPQLGIKLISQINRPDSSRKRKEVGGDPKNSSPKRFVWNKTNAVKMTRSIASRLGTCGFMPTRAQFARVQHKSLYNLIVKNQFSTSLTKFAKLCHLKMIHSNRRISEKFIV